MRFSYVPRHSLTVFGHDIADDSRFAFQILGSIVLGVGIWVAADKSSFIALLKLVENEHVDVSTLRYRYAMYGTLLFYCVRLVLSS